MKQSAKVTTTVSAHELSESETAQHRLRLDADEAELEESVIRRKIEKVKAQTVKWIANNKRCGHTYVRLDWRAGFTRLPRSSSSADLSLGMPTRYMLTHRHPRPERACDGAAPWNMDCQQLTLRAHVRAT